MARNPWRWPVSWRRRTARGTAALVAAVLAGAVGLADPGVAQGMPFSGSAQKAAAVAVIRPQAGRGASAAPEDVAVTGSGDGTGYHLYVAARGGGWRWRPLATIQPGGDEDQRWIGHECVTGDGKTAVVVVAPWSASNDAAGMDAGGRAYAVSLRTGVVRPLAAGVSLAYFNPGCGLGSSVALTGYLGPDQRPTKISVLDAASGSVTATSTVSGEITSAVPVGRRLLAARGGQLVDVTGNRAAVLASFSGQVSGLHPAASGGVDLIAQEGYGSAAVWSWGAGRGRRLGAGPAMAVRLFGGLGGRNLVAGVPVLAPGAGLGRLPAARDPLGASLRGGLELAERTGVQHTAAAAAGRSIAEAVAGSARLTGTDLPAPALRRFLALPTRSVVTSASAGQAAAGRAAAGPRAVPAAVTSVPQCAVPRDDIYKQAWQPTSAQVRWAVNQAVQGYLTSPYPDADRPPNQGMYAATDGPGGALAQAYASQDFPLMANVPQVPPLVMYGILAQESNWQQATWHAVPGRSANPLIANYYGDDANADTIDYSKADCGYGIAQLTSGMTQAGWSNGQLAPPSAQQVRVAVDYATNIAAGVQILQQKWQELHALLITMNSDDGAKIENWYAAIWAYNSGVHMKATGDPANGLGWLNNPANPIYPSPRHAFLHDGILETYGDAATPQNWPYQEKVFGWMEVPQLDLNGNPRYNGTYDWANKTGSFLDLPPESTFCGPVNNCDPSAIGKNDPNGLPVDPCPAENSACWWDAAVIWADCASQCVTDTPAHTPSGQTDYPGAGAAEPAAPPLSATCTPGAPVTAPGTVLVDDEMLADQNPAGNTPNLMGCSGSNTALKPPASAQASFSLQDSEGVPIGPPSPGSANSSGDIAAIDLHQIGGGLGGHLFFTHTRPASQSAQQVMGKWTATLPADTTAGTVYQIYAFVPDLAAAAGYAPYAISTDNASAGTGYGAPGFRHAALHRVINQASYTNQWASLGYYLCGGPDQLASPPSTTGPATCTMTVSLSNITPDGDPTQGSDIGYDAIAFVPVPAGRNVIIGDSYSSGEGLQGGFDDGTDVSASVPEASENFGDLCHRAPGAYGRLWDPNAIQLACSGSNMWDIAGVLYYQTLGSHNVPGGNVNGKPGSVYYVPPSGSTISNAPVGAGWTANGPAPGMDNWNFDNAGSDYYAEPTFQTDLLRALKPNRVILTLGGDDAMFAQVLSNCVALVATTSCQSLYTIPGSSADLLDNRITSLAAPLQAAFSNIASAAGGASKVVVLTYPNIFAPNPTVTNCTLITSSDLTWLIGKAKELDSTITSAATAAHITNIVDEYSTFSGHEMCEQPSDVTPPAAFPGTTSAIDNYFHPDSAGYLALEEKLAAQIGRP